MSQRTPASCRRGSHLASSPGPCRGTGEQHGEEGLRPVTLQDPKLSACWWQLVPNSTWGAELALLCASWVSAQVCCRKEALLHLHLVPGVGSSVGVCTAANGAGFFMLQMLKTLEAFCACQVVLSGAPLRAQMLPCKAAAPQHVLKETFSTWQPPGAPLWGPARIPSCFSSLPTLSILGMPAKPLAGCCC